MSEDEKYRVVGKVVLDLKSARHHLSCLKSKAKQMASTITPVVNILNGHAHPKTFNPHGWPTDAEVENIITEMVETAEEIASLAEQAKELGVE